MAVQKELFPQPEPAPLTQRGIDPEDAESRRNAPAFRAAGGRAFHAADDPAFQPGGAPVWLQRLSLFVLVLFCLYLGVLVAVLPWWTRIWDHNEFIQARPLLATILHNGAVRGVISGVGLLDIWIGISEAIHYRDYRD